MMAGALVLVGCYRAHERIPDAAAPLDAGTPLAACLPSGGTGGECPPDRGTRTWTVLRGTVAVGGRLSEVCVCAPLGCQPWIATGCRGTEPTDPPGLECAYTIPRNEGGGFCLYPCEVDADCPPPTRCVNVSEAAGYPYDMPRACFAVLR